MHIFIVLQGDELRGRGVLINHIQMLTALLHRTGSGTFPGLYSSSVRSMNIALRLVCRSSAPTMEAGRLLAAPIVGVRGPQSSDAVPVKAFHVGGAAETHLTAS
jgi:hypothetical protein